MAESITIGILKGSLRKNAYSSAAGRALEGLAPQGVTITQLPSPGTLPHFDQDVLDQALPDEARKLGQAIEAVDGVIVVSPEYNWSMPGLLKNAFDWLSRCTPAPLDNKPVTLITTSPGLLGGARAHPPIRQVLTCLAGEIMAKPEIQIAGAANRIDVESGTITDDATRKVLEAQLDKFAEFIRLRQRLAAA